MSDILVTVFTKPWKLDLPQLAKFIVGLGFDGIEMPVRPGYPVTPENVTEELPHAVRLLGEHNLKVASIAGPTDERTIAACAAAGVPVIRICVGMREHETYLEGEARLQREFDALVPILKQHQVTLGIQNHYGDRDVCNAMGLRHLVERYSPEQISAVWDSGHNGLQGESPEAAIDIVWSHLRMVNFKSAYWQRVNGPEAIAAAWKPHWTLGRHGRAQWPRVAAELRRRGYQGAVCLTAEYSDEASVDRLIAEDLTYARSLFEAVRSS